MISQKMKRMNKYLAIAITAIMLVACNNENKVTISGTYLDGTAQSITLEMLNVNQLDRVDSVKINKNGSFLLKTELENPELLLVKNENGQIINLLAFPGEDIELDIPDSNFESGYTVSGSSESDKVKLLVNRVEITKRKLDSIVQISNQTEDTTELKLLLQQYTDIFNKQRLFNVRFVVENISSLSSVYALYQRIGPEDYILNKMNDLQYLKIVADSVKIRYPESSLVISLVQDIARRTSEYENLLLLNKLAETTIEDTGNINLTIPDAEGVEISLRSLKGKVVLLNFWASMDNASRKSNQTLKGIYDKYHSKGFEIYSVSLDNNMAAWRDAIRFEDYKWIDVCELSYPNSYAASSYNIQAIPTTFLLDKEGNIIAKNIQGTLLATWLDNLL